MMDIVSLLLHYVGSRCLFDLFDSGMGTCPAEVLADAFVLF